METMALQTEIYETLSKLIETQSYSGHEQAIAQYIREWFRTKGIDTIEQDGNVIVVVPGKNRKLACVMNSHMDTVSAGDGWKTDPFRPVLEGDRLFGLGASDMKGGLAASLFLAAQVASGEQPEVDMWFTYVTKEEVDGSGTRAFADWFESSGLRGQYENVAAIFTEATNLKAIEHGNRGNIFVRLTAVGESGHASRPIKNEDHAVMKIIAFVNRLQLEFQTWREEFPSDVFEPPTVGIFTSIQAGLSVVDSGITSDSPNKFPASCTATIDVRTIPGFHEVAFDRIEQLATEYGVEVSYEHDASPSGYTSPDNPLVRAALMVIPNADLEVSQGSTDLGFLSQLGIPGVIFGPGEKALNHQPNESILLADVEAAIGLYYEIFLTWINQILASND